jgi:hypothetical protein
MAGYCSTGQSPQRDVVPVEEEEYICLSGRHEGLQGLEGRTVLNIVSGWK